MKFERKLEIIPPENMEKITQFSGRGTTIIGHKGIRARKMAFVTLDGAERKRNHKYGADRVERTLIEQWKTGQPWLLLSVQIYDIHVCTNNTILVVVYEARTCLSLVARKKWSQLCKTTDKWYAYKGISYFFCQNSNGDTNLVNNFLSEENA